MPQTFRHLPVLESSSSAVSTLTHRCREMPGCKLLPRHCELRKAKAKSGKGNPNSGGLHPFWICQDCPGPIEIASGESLEVQANPALIPRKPPQPPLEKKYLGNKCRECGTTEDARFRKNTHNGTICMKCLAATAAEGSHAAKARRFLANLPKYEAIFQAVKDGRGYKDVGLEYGYSDSSICLIVKKMRESKR